MKQAVRRKYHYIYKITREGGRYYIGMHSTDDLEDGYFGSGSLLSRSIKKHGKDKHKKEILEFLLDREALKLREKEIVNEELLGDKLCMNLRLGGNGGWDHINKNNRGAGGFATSKRRKESIDFCLMMSEKQSLAMKKFAEYNPEEMIKRQKRMTLAATTEKAKIKRKNTFAEIHHQSGEKNSQFGSCWVTNGVTPVKIRKEQLDEYTIAGYSRGRNKKI